MMTEKRRTLRLKPGSRPRALRGHPWVFANEISALLPEDYNGEAVELVDSRDRSLGCGIYNRRSQIVWRRFSRSRGISFDRHFLEGAVARAVKMRPPGRFRRLVWSEADHIPGLIVDQFDAVLAVQALTLAVELKLDCIREILEEQLSPREIIFRNDAPSRKYEGLPLNVKTASGKSFPPQWFRIHEIHYLLDFEKGNKNGFYLDQREQHPRIASQAKGKRVLDGFCNQGAFALQCAAAGAESVLAIDISAVSIARGRLNAEKNGLEVQFERENMFDFFTRNRERKFDLIILDPPSFARNRASLSSALRGYKELNLRALRMLSPGGTLATYSCSQHVSRRLFMKVLEDAAADAHREVRLLEMTLQPADHPVKLNFPESEYLKGSVLKADQ